MNNPFGDYAVYLDKIAGNRRKHKFLLTLYPTSEGSNWDFCNVTHEELVGQIRSLLSHYDFGAETRYLPMFLDFLGTIENLRRGTRMDPGFDKLLADRSDDVETFFTDVQRFKNELKQKVKNLQSLIEVSDPAIRVGTGSRATLSYTSIHIVNVATEDLLFHLNTDVSPGGWGDRLRSPH